MFQAGYVKSYSMKFHLHCSFMANDLVYDQVQQFSVEFARYKFFN